MWLGLVRMLKTGTSTLGYIVLRSSFRYRVDWNIFCTGYLDLKPGLGILRVAWKGLWLGRFNVKSISTLIIHVYRTMTAQFFSVSQRICWIHFGSLDVVMVVKGIPFSSFSNFLEIADSQTSAGTTGVVPGIIACEIFYGGLSLYSFMLSYNYVTETH